MDRTEFIELSNEKQMLLCPIHKHVRLEKDKGIVTLTEFHVYSFSPSNRYIFGKTDIADDTYKIMSLSNYMDEAVLICKFVGSCANPLNWAVLRDVVWYEENGFVKAVFWDYDSNKEAVKRVKLLCEKA